MRPSISTQTKVVCALGVMWAARGVSTLLTLELPDPGLPHQLVPSVVRTVLWIGTGLLAVLLALTGRRRPMTPLMIMPAMMAISYALDAVVAVVPPNPPGSWDAIPWLVWWCCWVGLLWVLSGVPWPELRMPREPDREVHADGSHGADA
ncbi:hypothetical protein FAM15346_001855 [Propionibacterium freudenreichii]|uniref:hypothetical protein n=1 Tax=Propionibacterium freudenreichii TaxID=1744 RepID=UPI00254A526B|nr:hypothetical protein [Propionibacterium freudenreichii]MDK9644789.1 hypothetical protein [Propionibacterium freudenreichii]